MKTSTVIGGVGRAATDGASQRETPHLLSKLAFIVLAASALSALHAADNAESAHRLVLENLLAGRFDWTASPPLMAPVDRPEDPCVSVKDPTIVQHDGRWHLFCTIRSRKRTHQIEYLSFADWKYADKAQRHILRINPGYFCAPQVFYFTPHRKWYLIHQISDEARNILQPAFSTSTNIADPNSWSAPTRLYSEHPDNVKGWIDFWVICDDSRAHLFFTSLDGKMWHAEAKLADFPHGWTRPKVVLEGDIFEASHTYRLKGLGKYLTLIEAIGQNGRRYYKAFLADRLDGEWTPLAATREKPFASPVNVRDSVGHWTDSFSHGELLRSGYDERLEVDPGHLRFLFQGVSDEQRAGKSYGEIPWRLGILEPVK